MCPGLSVHGSRLSRSKDGSFVEPWSETEQRGEKSSLEKGSSAVNYSDLVVAELRVQTHGKHK